MRALLTLLLLILTPGLLPAQSIRVTERLEDLEALARTDSLDAVAHYNLAMGYLSRRRWDRGDSALARATDLDPRFAAAWLARGAVRSLDSDYWRRVYRERGDTGLVAESRRLREYLRRAFLIDPFVDIRLLGGLSFLGMGAPRPVRAVLEGRYDEALEGLTRELAESPPAWARPTYLWFHALAAFHSNQLPAAARSLEELLSLAVAAERDDTTRATPLRTNDYRYMLGVVQLRLGDTVVARQMLEGAREQDIGNYMIQVQLARIHEARRNWEAALAARQAALEANPEDHTLHLELGETLGRAGRLVAAESALVHARDLNPRDPRVHYRLGMVRLARQEHGLAREALERFVAMAPRRYATAIRDAQSRLAALP